tara:strand:+ start:352 stop:597 length:246 start_codon:yes stop_codon:yes gene_type:complete
LKISEEIAGVAREAAPMVAPAAELLMKLLLFMVFDFNMIFPQTLIAPSYIVACKASRAKNRKIECFREYLVEDYDLTIPIS